MNTKEQSRVRVAMAEVTVFDDAIYAKLAEYLEKQPLVQVRQLHGTVILSGAIVDGQIEGVLNWMYAQPERWAAIRVTIVMCDRERFYQEG